MATFALPSFPAGPTVEHHGQEVLPASKSSLQYREQDVSQQGTPFRSIKAFTEDLPGLTGVACQGRWAPSQALTFAGEHDLTHFYVDSSSKDYRREMTLAMAEVRNCQMIFHGDYRRAIASPNAAVQREAIDGVLTEIEIASQLRAPLIVHATSAMPLHGNIPDHDASLQAFDAALTALEGPARQAQVPLWIENLPLDEAAVFNTAADYALILERHPAVSVVYDVGHAHVANQNPFELLRQFPDRIAALSLSDNDGVFDRHWPLGQGSIRFDELLRIVEAVRWRGLYVFETMGSNIEADVTHLHTLRS